jgi:hypothetical protein
MGVAAYNKPMGVTAAEVRKLKGFQFVRRPASIKAVGQDHGPNLQAAALVLAVWGPVPVLGLRRKRRSLQEVGDTPQRSRNPAGIRHQDVVIVVPHQRMTPNRGGKSTAQRAQEGRSMLILVE